MSGSGDETVLSNVRLLDPSMSFPERGPVDIRISGGLVIAIDPTAVPDPAMAGAERWILPGLVNCHDHLYSHELRDPVPTMDLAEMRAWIDRRDSYETLARMAGAAWEQLRHGILVVRDLGAIHGLNTVLARLIRDGLIAGPEVVAAGRPIVMTGGHVWTFGREADGPDDCRRAVREQAKAGAQVIKIMASGGLSHFPSEDYHRRQFTDAELVAIIDEAHARGLPTCAHAFGADAVARVVAAGIDSVEHGVRIDEPTLDEMVRRDVSYVPTMTNMARIASPEFNDSAGRAGRSEELTRGVVEPHRDTFRRAVAAGIRIGVGTDSLGDYKAEILLMASLGMSSEAVIAAATVDGARICGRSGEPIAIGARADLIVLDGDPREDLTVLTSPSIVLRAGRPVVGVGPWTGGQQPGSAR